MQVVKRNGSLQAVHFDEITTRLAELSIDLKVDYGQIAKETISSLYNGICVSQIDRISAKIADSSCLTHPDNGILASRVLITNQHKSTPAVFSVCMKMLDRLKPDIMKIVETGIFDDLIDHSRDYLLDYAGFIITEEVYLEKIGEVTVDRYQYLLMRCAIATANITYNEDGTLTLSSYKFIAKSYSLLSTHAYTNATPTLINALKIKQQMISCFLYGTEDSVEGIMWNARNTAVISKWAGGIGIHMHNIRSGGRLINGTGGKAAGLQRQLKIYNEIALTFDQGGRRKGAFAIYLEPWHGDIVEVLSLKLPQGDEALRARDLFYGLWVPDYFVKQVMNDGNWYLFSADVAPGLSDVYDGMEVCSKCNNCLNSAYAKYVLPYLDCKNDTSYGVASHDDTNHVDISKLCAHNYVSVDAFTILYNIYVRDGKHLRMVKARMIMDMICASQRDSGTPYILFKDHVNAQSNQKNIGTIKSSNLCTEIVQYSDDTSYACCCLASVNLANLYCEKTDCMDYESLHDTVEHITHVLDNILTNNDYPVDECIANVQNYRPVGIGVQGLADLFNKMKIPFDSPQAAAIDVRIFETLYHAALTASCELAKIRGAYPAFAGSPASKGILKLDMWRKMQAKLETGLSVDEHYDWATMRTQVMGGIRNSLLIAPMPTAMTAIIMGNNESFEPCFSNLYVKNTSVLKYTRHNKHMVSHMRELGLWDKEMLANIIDNGGSVQNIPRIPPAVQAIYKTVFEIKQNDILRRASLRSAFIDQSQSLNIHLNTNANSVLYGVFLTAWKLGLTTGSYYIRTKSKTTALRNDQVAVEEVCAIGCTSCSS
jgi:ribonucleotide reductase alpha subunit